MGHEPDNMQLEQITKSECHAQLLQLTPSSYMTRRISQNTWDDCLITLDITVHPLLMRYREDTIPWTW